MAGVLDSARLRYFISEVTGVCPTKIEAMTLGSHGDAMIALPRQATVDGKPLPDLVDEATLQQLFQRTRDGGAEIVGLLKSGFGLLRTQRIGRRHGRGHRDGFAHHAARVRVGDRPVRDRRCLRRCARDAGARSGSSRSSSSTSTRTSWVAAARSSRGHPRQVRGPREAVAVDPSSRRAREHAFAHARRERAARDGHDAARRSRANRPASANQGPASTFTSTKASTSVRCCGVAPSGAGWPTRRRPRWARTDRLR